MNDTTSMWDSAADGIQAEHLASLSALTEASVLPLVGYVTAATSASDLDARLDLSTEAIHRRTTAALEGFQAPGEALAQFDAVGHATAHLRGLATPVIQSRVAANLTAARLAQHQASLQAQAAGPITWVGDTHMGASYVKGKAANGDNYEVYFNPNSNPTPCSWVNYGPNLNGDTAPLNGTPKGVGRGFTTMIEAMTAAEADAAGGKTGSRHTAAVVSEHAQRFVDGLNAKHKDDGPWSGYQQFGVTPGKRMDKVWTTHHAPNGDEATHSKAVHAFVERETGHVYKPDGWARPASGVRYHSVDEALKHSDIHGGYLYRKGSLSSTSSAKTAGWIDQARAVVNNKQFKTVTDAGDETEQTWKSNGELGSSNGGMVLDGFTASMLVQIYDAMSAENQAKFAAMPLTQAVTIGWKLVNKTSSRTAATGDDAPRGLYADGRAKGQADKAAGKAPDAQANGDQTQDWVKGYWEGYGAKTSARTAPTPDDPSGYEYTPAPDWVAKACRRRFEGGGATALDPKHPGHYLHGVGDWVNGPNEVKDNGDHSLSFTNPYTRDTDRFDETGYYDHEGNHKTWGSAYDDYKTSGLFASRRAVSALLESEGITSTATIYEVQTPDGDVVYVGADSDEEAIESAGGGTILSRGGPSDFAQRDWSQHDQKNSAAQGSFFHHQPAPAAPAAPHDYAAQAEQMRQQDHVERAGDDTSERQRKQYYEAHPNEQHGTIRGDDGYLSSLSEGAFFPHTPKSPMMQAPHQPGATPAAAPAVPAAAPAAPKVPHNVVRPAAPTMPQRAPKSTIVQAEPDAVPHTTSPLTSSRKQAGPGPMVYLYKNRPTGKVIGLVDAALRADQVYVPTASYPDLYTLVPGAEDGRDGTTIAGVAEGMWTEIDSMSIDDYVASQNGGGKISAVQALMQAEAVNEDATGADRYQHVDVTQPTWTTDWSDPANVATPEDIARGLSATEPVENPFNKTTLAPSGVTASRKQAGDVPMTTKPHQIPGNDKPNLVTVEQETIPADPVVPGYDMGTAAPAAPVDPTMPTTEQVVAARIARIATRVRLDNPEMDPAHARLLAVATVKAHPEMVAPR